MIPTQGYAALSPNAMLTPFSFERRELGPEDVLIEILYCGVCHSDIHQVRDEWGGAQFPMVPGHEIVGRVVRTGTEAKKHNPGDLVGVGCMVDSCQNCEMCYRRLEQYCESSCSFTYNSTEQDKKTPTQGGYSKQIVVKDHFVLKIPSNLPLSGVAPLLCAGVTTYSPLRHWNVRFGQKVAVVGLGGLGHMAVKLACAMGAEVTVFSNTANKAEDARRMGARHFVISKDEDAIRARLGYFDLVLDTVSAQHELNPFLDMLRVDGTMVLVGAPPNSTPLPAFSLINGRKNLTGSLIGGITETQEMLDFCGKHGITADVEVIPANKINEAYERTLRSDVRYRFVIDCSTI